MFCILLINTDYSSLYREKKTITKHRKHIQIVADLYTVHIKNIFYCLLNLKLYINYVKITYTR